MPTEAEVIKAVDDMVKLGLVERVFIPGRGIVIRLLRPQGVPEAPPAVITATVNPGADETEK